MNYPTPTNPLILRYRGHIPALKNDKNLVPSKDGKSRIIPSQEVEQFFARCKSMKRQVERQGFSCMAFPQPVAAYVEIGFFTSHKYGMSLSDGDNAYTTLCETWQHPAHAKGSGPVLAVIENDRQVVDWHPIVTSVPRRELEGATAYLWAISRDTPWWPQRVEFMTAYMAGKFALDVHEDGTLTFDEIDDLF